MENQGGTFVKLYHLLCVNDHHDIGDSGLVLGALYSNWGDWV